MHWYLLRLPAAYFNSLFWINLTRPAVESSRTLYGSFHCSLYNPSRKSANLSAKNRPMYWTVFLMWFKFPDSCTQLCNRCYLVLCICSVRLASVQSDVSTPLNCCCARQVSCEPLLIPRNCPCFCMFWLPVQQQISSINWTSLTWVLSIIKWRSTALIWILCSDMELFSNKRQQYLLSRHAAFVRLLVSAFCTTTGNQIIYQKHFMYTAVCAAACCDFTWFRPVVPGFWTGRCFSVRLDAAAIALILLSDFGCVCPFWCLAMTDKTHVSFVRAAFAMAQAGCRCTALGILRAPI